MKKGLSVEDHKKQGAILKTMYLDSIDMLVTCSRAYPKNNRLNIQLRKLHNIIIQIKSEADNMLFKDHPSALLMDGCGIYYGANRLDENKTEQEVEK